MNKCNNYSFNQRFLLLYMQCVQELALICSLKTLLSCCIGFVYSLVALSFMQTNCAPLVGLPRQLSSLWLTKNKNKPRKLFGPDFFISFEASLCFCHLRLACPPFVAELKVGTASVWLEKKEVVMNWTVDGDEKQQSRWGQNGLKISRGD